MAELIDEGPRKEQLQDKEREAREKSLASSNSSGELNKLNPVPDSGVGKSPGKTRKQKKGLFKKSAPQEEGNFVRSSGRGKRKSGRDKKLEQRQDSKELIDEAQHQAAVASTSPPVLHQSTEESYQYDSQEVEHKSTLDVSVKKYQKANKELLRHNTQLTKLVENLKKEKELLVSERVKLKAENKSLEKELKKAGSREHHRLAKKLSQPLLDDSIDLLKEKVQSLEDQVTERDQIISLLKLRMENSQLAESVERTESAKDAEKSSVVMKNGYVLDSSAALDLLLEEHDTSLRLKRENEELRSRLASVEAEGQREQGCSSPPRSPRKRSSSFFKRGKKNTSSGTLKNEEAQQVRADLVRSHSPEMMMKSDSHHEQLDMPMSPLHSQKESSISLPTYSPSPSRSPHTPTKNRAHAEIVTLQSCLRVALEEKNESNECLALLEKELDGTKSKVSELEESIAASADKASKEIQQLKSNLEAAKLERDTFCGELKVIQHEVDELSEKNDSKEQMYVESLSKKNERIEELEQQIEALKRSKITSPPYNKPPLYGFSAKKQVSASPEKVASPHQSKEYSFGDASSKLAEPSVNKTKQLESKAEKPREKQQESKMDREKQQEKKMDREKQQESKVAKASEKQKVEKQDAKSVRIRDKKAEDKQQESKPEKATGIVKKQDTKLVERQQEVKSENTEEEPEFTVGRYRAPSVDLTKHEKSEKNSKEKSVDNSLKAVPPSPTRRMVGRLSRESSIDRFENPPVKDIRKNSTTSIPSPSLAHSPKVAATRAMFEQKIDETKTDMLNVRKTSKTSLSIDQRRRSSVSVVTAPKEPVQPQHSKSYSCDFSSKQTTIQELSEQSTGRTSHSKTAHPTHVMEQINEPRTQSNEAKNIQTQHQKQEKSQQPSSAIATVRKSKPSDTVTKVSRITVTSIASPTNSPILSARKDLVSSSPTPKGDQHLLQSSATVVRHPTSPSLGTSQRMSSSPTAKGQTGQSSTKVSAVSSTFKHSSPAKAATVSEISQPTTRIVHSPVAKSQTESRLQPPMNRSSGFWSVNSSTTATTTATSTSTVSTPVNRVVVKASSRLGDNLLSSSSVNKTGSLQNISAQFNGENKTPPQNDNSSSSSVAVPSSSGVKRAGPTQRAIQRRERKDRPKTMYAGRAETANLVNLISRFQEAEKDKQIKESKTNGVSQTPSSSASAPKMNGVPSSSSTTPVKFSGVSIIPSSTSTVAPLRQTNTAKDNKLSRPTSYCATNMSNTEGLNLSSSYSSSKPLPHERIMQRSRTVAGGLGMAKQSKKAMLLKWCQIITQDYENVNINNFAESFANGLAFCAMIHHFLPDQIPFSTLNPANRESNFKIAFQAAEGVGIPSLLDVEDMVSLPKPDWMSVMTYVSFIYNKFGQQQQQQQQNQSSMV